MKRANEEKTTREVADLLGITPELIRKYKARGFLKKAPQGVSGQGRSVQCMWSQEAVTELREFLKIQRNSGTRYGKSGRCALANGGKE